MPLYSSGHGGTRNFVYSLSQIGYRRIDDNFLNPPGTAATEARLNAEAQEAMDREFRL